MVLLRRQVIVVWFPRDTGIELMGGLEFGSGGSVGTKAKSEEGGGYDQKYDNIYGEDYIVLSSRINNNI